MPGDLTRLARQTTIHSTEKGKPVERRGRKASGLRVLPMTAGLPGCKAEIISRAPALAALMQTLALGAAFLVGIVLVSTRGRGKGVAVRGRPRARLRAQVHRRAQPAALRVSRRRGGAGVLGQLVRAVPCHARRAQHVAVGIGFGRDRGAGDQPRRRRRSRRVDRALARPEVPTLVDRARSSGASTTSGNSPTRCCSTGTESSVPNGRPQSPPPDELARQIEEISK